MQQSAKAERVLGRLDVNAKSVVFLTRLNPIPYPAGAESMLFWASKVAFWKHLSLSLAGLSATMTPLTVAGSPFECPSTVDFFIPVPICFLVVFVLFVAYKKLYEVKLKT